MSRRKAYLKVLCLLFVVGIVPAVHGKQVQERFQEANQSYYRGDYKKASEQYSALLETKQAEDPVIYHNLGNAHFRVGAYGHAVFAYRRGLTLHPNQDLAQALQRNLRVTRRALQERYRSEAEGSQFIYGEPGGLFYRVTHLTAESLLTGSFLVVAWCFFLLLLSWRLAKSSAKGLYWAWSVPVGILLVLLAVLAAGRHYTDEHLKIGVVIEDGVQLREGPHPDARGITLPEGMEVRLVDDSNDWVRVELGTGRDGWVNSTSVKSI